MIRIIILLFLALNIKGQVPYKLNSFPSARATFYLDFDGQTVSTAYWNRGNTFYATPSKLTPAQIDSVFKIVAEDFRPFNVNVTTDSTVYFGAPLLKRQRVIITDTSEWYAGVGGVAYIGSFIWGLEIPCFVFTDILKTARNSSEAISHEIGHTLNLYHQSQCNSTGGFALEYNPGKGVGETSWSPIMGDSYSRNLTIWHNGPTSFGCTSLQDDLAVITSSNNGFGYRPDIVGNTIEQATPVSININTLSFSELINRTNDTDFYKIVLPKRGRLILTANPYNLGGNRVRANIDIEMSLYNGTNLLEKYNPLTRLNAVLDTTLNAGTYHISINNVANANIDNYGMIGSYNVEGTFTVEEALNLVLPDTPNQIQRQIELINISGNTSTGLYQVSLPNRNNFREIRIYSITGTLLKSIRNLQKINMIDISRYSSGIYIVDIDNIKSFKIIKQ